MSTTLLSRMFLQWKREYLTSLRERCNANKKQLRKLPKLGDIVTIYNDKTSRQRWKLGKIVRLLPGKDNLVRAAELRTVDNSGKSIIVKRPIQHLIPLEVDDKLVIASDEENQNKVADNVAITTSRDEDVPEVIQ